MNRTAQGESYEQFVESLYQRLLVSQGLEDVRIERNKTDLASSSGCAHQIDIYWEFKFAGQIYRTAIECKAYNRTVPIGRVRDFYGVLSDIPGLKGVMVSMLGFQSGAKQFARHYDIGLEEIRSPSEHDWQGRVRNISLEFHVIVAEIKELRIDATQEFLQSLDADEEISLPFEGTTHDAILVDDEGNDVASLEDIRLLLPTDNRSAVGRQETLPFPNRYYRPSEGNLVPIDSVTVRYDVNVEVENLEIKGDEIVEAIMKNTLSGDRTIFRRDGDVKKMSS